MGDAVAEDSSPASSSIIAMLRGEHEAMLTLAGDVDDPTVVRLGHLLTGLCAAGARYVVVDLSEVVSCDHAARPLFAKLQRRLQLSQGWMLLVDPPPVLADLGPESLEAAFAAYRRVAASAAPSQSPPPAPEVA